MGKKLLSFQLSKPSALALIRRLAQNSKNVGFSDHALKQMKKRRINPNQVLRCLQKGVVMEEPYIDIKGNWTCTMELFTAGERIRVITAIERIGDGGHLIIITAYGGR